MNPDIIYNDRYRLDANIGEGGMAVVYRGYDLILRRQVAIKVLRAQFSSDPRFVERFGFEAQAAAKLTHPNIVTVYDVGRANGSHYIVQEFVAGETLATIIARERRLPESAAIRYARQLCAALSAAHRQGVLHRDVKPSNVLITREDVVRLTDFGIAGALESHGAARGRVDPGVVADENVLGSLPYCAPEVLAGEAVAEPADLHSLGVVLYEMVTGVQPYRASSADALAHKIVNGSAPEVSASDFSPELGPVVIKLLQKSPSDRYRSAGELLGALRRISRSPAEEEEEEGAPTTPDSATRVLRRRQRAVQLAGTDLPPEPPAPVWRAARAAVIAAATVALFVALSLVIAAQRASSHSVRIPDLSGKSVAEAIAALRALGVDDIAIRQRPDAAVQGGLVDGTDPAASSPVRSNSSITLLVSEGPPMIEVPSVLGLDPNSARVFLAGQGFDVRFGKPAHSATIRQGLVGATNPAPGAPITKGGVVVIAVSSGPEMVQVPNIVSMTMDDARKVLAKLGLKLGVSSTIAVNSVPAGVILSQDPIERGTIAPGSTVMVDVSAGSQAIEVPQVVGQTLDAARQTLTNAGLAVGNVVEAAVPDQTPGTVVNQTPGAFARASEGAVVDLVVAAGATPAGVPGGNSGAGPSGSAGSSLIPVPNVIGMPVDQAKSFLERHGYRVDRVTVVPGSAPNDLKVLSTDPPVGTKPPAGTNGITLIVGQ